MKHRGSFELQLHLFDILAALVVDMYVNEDTVATDPSLTMETCRQLHCLCTVSL